MTYLKESPIFIFSSVTAAFFTLLIWPFLAYMALTLIVIYCFYKAVQNHPEASKLIGQFLAEFVGFGLVIVGFLCIFVFLGMFFV